MLCLAESSSTNKALAAPAFLQEGKPRPGEAFAQIANLREQDWNQMSGAYPLGKENPPDPESLCGAWESVLLHPASPWTSTGAPAFCALWSLGSHALGILPFHSPPQRRFC